MEAFANKREASDMTEPSRDTHQALETRLRKIHSTNLENGWYKEQVTTMSTLLLPPPPRPDSLWARLRQLFELRLVSTTHIEYPFACSLNQPDPWLIMLATGELAWRQPPHKAYEVLNLQTLSAEDLLRVSAEIEQWWIVYRRPIKSTSEFRPDNPR